MACFGCSGWRGDGWVGWKPRCCVFLLVGLSHADVQHRLQCFLVDSFPRQSSQSTDLQPRIQGKLMTWSYPCFLPLQSLSPNSAYVAIASLQSCTLP